MLAVADPVRAAVIAHAREGAPEEVVGVLAGIHGEEGSTVERSLRAANAADAPRTRYRSRRRRSSSCWSASTTRG